MGKSRSDLDTWRLVAAEVLDSASVTLTVPLFVLAGESVDVARFHAKYWNEQQQAGKTRRRGLSSAMKNGQLGPKTGEEILSLREAVSQAQAQYFLTFDQNVNPTERGYFLLGEMTATLEYLLDDGIEDEKDAQLDRIDAAHADDPGSFDALASALDDHAALADVHGKAMSSPRRTALALGGSPSRRGPVRRRERRIFGADGARRWPIFHDLHPVGARAGAQRQGAEAQRRRDGTMAKRFASRLCCEPPLEAGSAR